MLRADTEARCEKTGKSQLSQLSRVPQFVCFTSLAVSFMTQCHKCHNCPFTSLAVSFMTHCQTCHNCPFASLVVSFTQVSSSGHGDVAGGCSTFTSSWVVWSWPQMWIQRPARTTALPHSLQDLKMLRFQAMCWMMPWGIFPPTSSQMLGIQANDRAMLSLGRSTDRTPT